jgi:hypothetical protein
VLDGHHDASDPAGLVGSALGKIVRALPEPVAAQAEAVPAQFRIVRCPELAEAARVLGRRLLAAGTPGP